MQIEYACGHSGRVSTKESWKANGDCHECYIKAKDEARAKAAIVHEAASVVAAAKAAELGLPALAGSEKQIGWANTIRATRLDEASPYIDKQIARFADPEVAAAQDTPDKQALLAVTIQTWDAMLVWLLSRTDAKWWIDSRDERTITLLEQHAMSMLKTSPSWLPFYAASAAKAPRTLASIASWVNDYPADSRVAKDGLRLSATTSITRAEGESILAILDADPAMAEIRRSHHAERVYDASDAWRKAKEVSDRNRSFMEGYERGTVRVGGRPPTQQQVEDHRRRTTESEGVTATAFAALEAIRAEVV